VRSWPVLLVIFGLNVLIGQRVRFANWAILTLGVVMIVVIANIAYAERKSEYRTENRIEKVEAIPPEVTQLVVRVSLRDSRATLSNSVTPHQFEAVFVGSNESDLDIALEVDGTTGILTITENRPGVLPRLREVGRGSFDLRLPPDIPIDSIEYLIDDGPMTADLRNATVRGIKFTVKRGNMKLCLPLQGVILQDKVQIENGDLHLVIPPGTPLSFSLDNAQKTVDFNPASTGNEYQFLADGTLQSRLTEEYRILLNLNIEGAILLDHEDSCNQP
jgi:hypothetical protein